MQNNWRMNMMKSIHQLEGTDHLTAVIAYGTAATLYRKKPASVVALTDSGKNAMALWQRTGPEVAAGLGMSFRVLRQCRDRIVILFYRAPMLRFYLQHTKNLPFLRSYGYRDEMTLDEKLDLLTTRFSDLCPHEVGIFLGIPVEDVLAFIDQDGQNCMMCRYWKVYHNPRRAEILFDQYDQALRQVARAIGLASKGIIQAPLSEILAA